ncbi:MAG: type II toxin-antitoxin system Phd/YefM family antitoxin [Fibrobacterota bacterium]
MISTAFTEFRKHTARYLDKVENGDRVIITRYGRPVAEISVPTSIMNGMSWKRPALRLKITGASLASAILSERKKSRS